MAFNPIYAKNNAFGVLRYALDSTSTVMILESNLNLPLDVDSYRYHLTITDSTDEVYSEIVEPVTYQISNEGYYHYQILRGMQDTEPKSWPEGSVIKLNVTAEAINQLNSEILRVGTLHDSFEPRIQTVEAQVMDTDALNELTGFPNTEDSTISFDDSLGRFTISPTNTEFSVYINNEIKVYETSVYSDIDDIEGFWYFYFDEIGLKCDQSLPDKGIAHVATVYWNSNLNISNIVSDDRHGFVMDWATKNAINTYIGPKVEGFDIYYEEIDDISEPSSDNYCRLYLDSGFIYNTDMKYTVVNSLTPEDPFEQYLGVDTTSMSASLPIFYLDDEGKWVKTNNPSNYPFMHTGGNSTPLVNVSSESGWGVTNLGNGELGPDGGTCCSYWIVATNDMIDPIILLMGQQEYLNVEDARLYDTPQNIDWGLYPFPVQKILYQIIIYADPIWNNTIHRCKISEVIDYRYVNTKDDPDYISHSLLPALDYERSGHIGFQKQAHITTRPPSSNDDEYGNSEENIIFHAGMNWLDSSTNILYICRSAENESAVWEQVPTSSTGTFSEDVTLQKGLIVSKSASIGENLIVTGNLDVESNVSLKSNLDVTGKSVLHDDLELSQDKKLIHGINEDQGGIASIFEYMSTIPGESEKKMVSWYETDTTGNVLDSNLQLAALTSEGKFVVQSGLYVTPDENTKSIHITHDTASTTGILKSSDFDGNLLPFVVLADPFTIYGELKTLNGAEFNSYTRVKNILSFHDLATLRFDSYNRSMIFDYQFSGMNINVEDQTSSDNIVNISSDGNIRINESFISSPNYSENIYDSAVFEFNEENESTNISSIKSDETLLPMVISGSNIKFIGDSQFVNNIIFDEQVLFDGVSYINDSLIFSKGTPLKFETSDTFISILGIDTTGEGNISFFNGMDTTNPVAYLTENGQWYTNQGILISPDLSSIEGSIYFRNEDDSDDGLYIVSEKNYQKSNIVLDANTVIVENDLFVKSDLIFGENLGLLTGRFFQFGKDSITTGIDGIAVGYYEGSTFFEDNIGFLRVSSVDTTGNIIDDYARVLTDKSVEIPVKISIVPENNTENDSYLQMYSDGEESFIISKNKNEELQFLNINARTNFLGSVFTNQNVYLKENKLFFYGTSLNGSIASSLLDIDDPTLFFYPIDNTGNIEDSILGLSRSGTLMGKTFEIHYNDFPYTDDENTGRLKITELPDENGAIITTGNPTTDTLHKLKIVGSEILIEGDLNIDGDFLISGNIPWTTGGIEWPLHNDGTSNSYIYYAIGTDFNVLARFNEEYENAISWSKTDSTGTINDTFAMLGMIENNNTFAIDGRLMTVVKDSNEISRMGILEWNDATGYDRLEISAYDPTTSTYKDLHIKASSITSLGDIKIEGPLGVEKGYGINLYGDYSKFNIQYYDDLVGGTVEGYLRFFISEGPEVAKLENDGNLHITKLSINNTNESEDRNLIVEYDSDTDMMSVSSLQGEGYLNSLNISTSQMYLSSGIKMYGDLEFQEMRENYIKFYNDALLDNYLGISCGFIDGTNYDINNIIFSYNTKLANKHLASIGEDGSIFKDITHVSTDDDNLFNYGSFTEFSRTRFVRYEDDSNDWGLFIEAENKDSSTPETRITLSADRVKIKNIELAENYFRSPDITEIYNRIDDSSLILSVSYDEDVLVEQVDDTPTETRFGYLSYDYTDSLDNTVSGVRITPWGIVSRKQLQISEEPYDDAAFASTAATATMSITTDESEQKTFSISAYDFNLDEYYSTHLFTTEFNVIGNLRVTGNSFFENTLTLREDGQIKFDGDDHDMFIKYNNDTSELVFELLSSPITLFSIGEDRNLSNDLTIFGASTDQQKIYPPDYDGGGTLRYIIDGTDSYIQRFEIVSHYGKNPDSGNLSDIVVFAKDTYFDTDIIMLKGIRAVGTSVFEGDVDFTGQSNLSGTINITGDIILGSENSGLYFSGDIYSDEGSLKFKPENNITQFWNNIELMSNDPDDGIKNYIKFTSDTTDFNSFYIVSNKSSDIYSLDFKKNNSDNDYISLLYNSTTEEEKTRISTDIIELYSDITKIGRDVGLYVDTSDSTNSISIYLFNSIDDEKLLSFNNLNGNINILKDIEFNGNIVFDTPGVLTVSSDAIFEKGVLIDNLTVSNKTTLDSCDVLNNIDLYKTLNIFSDYSKVSLYNDTTTGSFIFEYNDSTNSDQYMLFNIDNNSIDLNKNTLIYGNLYITGDIEFGGDFEFNKEMKVLHSSDPSKYLSIHTKDDNKTYLGTQSEDLFIFDLNTNSVTIDTEIILDHPTTVNQPITFNALATINHGLDFLGQIELSSSEHNSYFSFITEDDEHTTKFVAHPNDGTSFEVFEINLNNGEVTLKQDFTIDHQVGWSFGEFDLLIPNRTVELMGDVIMNQKTIWNDSTDSIDGFFAEFNRDHTQFLNEPDIGTLLFYFADGTNNIIGPGFEISGNAIAQLDQGGTFATRGGFIQIIEDVDDFKGVGLKYYDSYNKTFLTSYGDSTGSNMSPLHLQSLHLINETEYSIFKGLGGASNDLVFQHEGMSDGSIGKIIYSNEDIETKLLNNDSITEILSIDGLVRTINSVETGELSIRQINENGDNVRQAYLSGRGVWKFGPNDSSSHGILTITGSDSLTDDDGAQFLMVPSAKNSTTKLLEHRLFERKYQMNLIDGISGGNDFDSLSGITRYTFFELDYDSGYDITLNGSLNINGDLTYTGNLAIDEITVSSITVFDDDAPYQNFRVISENDNLSIVSYDSTSSNIASIGLSEFSDLNVIIGYESGIEDFGSYNTIVGAKSGKDTGQFYNSFYGYFSGANITDYLDSTSIVEPKETVQNMLDYQLTDPPAAYEILINNIGRYETCVGIGSGINRTLGFLNTSIGAFAGSDSTGSVSVMIGSDSGSNSTGDGSVLIGPASGKNSYHFASTYVGIYSGYNSSQEHSVIIGPTSGMNSTGEYNIFLGNESGKDSTGDDNVFLGRKCGENGQEYDRSVFIGNNAGRDCIDYDVYSTRRSAFNNTFVGYSAGEDSTGNSNCFYGYFSGNKSSGTENTGIGKRAGQNNSGDYNSSLGFQAGYSISGDNNVSLGNNSGYNITGSVNVSIGYEAGNSSVGNYNCFISDTAGVRSNGINNICIGPSSGMDSACDNLISIGMMNCWKAEGLSNISIGINSNSYFSNTYIGKNNTLLGQESFNIDSTSCVIIGNDSTSDTCYDSNIFGSGSYTNTQNTTILGNNIIVDTVDDPDNDKLYLRIDDVGNEDTLTIDSTGRVFINTSSIRYKKNIRDIDIDTELVYNLRPVTFEYKSSDKTSIGLIAEEVNDIIPELVTLDIEGKPHGVKYAQLSVLLLKEIQKLKKEIEELKSEKSGQT